jgi:eukaryotic-like serine/threonine-protein kinase
MGEAFLAVSTGTAGVRKPCVLKLLHGELLAEPSARQLFFHEAQIASKLDHPAIVCAYDFGEDDDGTFYLAMEYVHGQPWSRVRAHLSPARLPLVAHVRILRDLLDALDHAHDFVDFDGRPLGVVHRDVAPGNVMVDYSGRVKLLDFGIAKSTDAKSQIVGKGFRGKLPYVSPEQIAGFKVDRRADLYAVGAMLWESIARKKRSDGPAEDVLAARLKDTEPRIEDVVPNVDPELAVACGKALALRPSDRFASAAEMANRLDAWLAPREEECPRKTWAPHVRAKYEEERAVVHKALLDEVGALSDTTGPYLTGSYLSLSRSMAPPRLRPLDTAAAFALPSLPPPLQEDVPRESVDPRPTTLSTPVPVFDEVPKRQERRQWIVASALAFVAVLVLGFVGFTFARAPQNPPPALGATSVEQVNSEPSSEPLAPANAPSDSAQPVATATEVPSALLPGQATGPSRIPHARPQKPSLAATVPMPSTTPAPTPRAPTIRPLDEADPYTK